MSRKYSAVAQCKLKQLFWVVHEENWFVVAKILRKVWSFKESMRTKFFIFWTEHLPGNARKNFAYENDI